ncbi:MAG: anthranilate phosphoribosyltransferase, partial [Eubacterium sp.]
MVYGMDCLDEISACKETKVAEIRNADIKYYTIKPEDFGFERYEKADLLGGTPEENAQITKNVLSGKATPAQRTAVLLNAGAGIYVAHPEMTLNEAVKRAQELIDSGKAYEKMTDFIQHSNE